LGTEAAFGEAATKATIIASLDEARQVVLQAGIGTGNTSRSLVDALDRFRNVQFDDALTAARSLVKQEDGAAALPHLGRGRPNAVEAATALAEAASAFLDAVDQNLAAYGLSHDAKASSVAGSLGRIDAALQTIEIDVMGMSASAGESADAA
jgi:hypothetical protein